VLVSGVGESLLGALAGENRLDRDRRGRRRIEGRPARDLLRQRRSGLAYVSEARLLLQSVPSFAAKLTAAGWREIFSTFIICDQDRAIPPAAQEHMAQRAGTVHRLDSSHSPFLSNTAGRQADPRGWVLGT
jgi:hypothetical protein